jgi:hypothetical protein
MKLSNIRFTKVDPEPGFSESATIAKSTEKYFDNVKTFKPKILVSDVSRCHMSRNAIIESSGLHHSSFNDTPLLGSPIRENGPIGHKNQSFHVT